MEQRYTDFNSDSKFYYWLRSPRANSDDSRVARTVGSEGNISGITADESSIGVRPAFYLDTMNVTFRSGDGSLNTPYIVKSEEPIKVIYNEKEISFDQNPIIENGRTLVPMRAIFEAMGATVSWEGATKTITAIRNNPVTKNSTVTVMQIDNSTMTVYGDNIILDVPPKIVNNRTLVPVRAITESFYANVSWNENTRTVNITSK